MSSKPEDSLRTYIVRIYSESGIRLVQLRATSFEEAEAALHLQTRNVTSTSIRYTIQEQSPPDYPLMLSALMNATVALTACLVVLVVAKYQLRKWLGR